MSPDKIHYSGQIFYLRPKREDYFVSGLSSAPDRMHHPM